MSETMVTDFFQDLGMLENLFKTWGILIKRKIMD